MKVTIEIEDLTDFEKINRSKWYKLIYEAGMEEELWTRLEDAYPDGCDEYAINDYLNFDTDLHEEIKARLVKLGKGHLIG